MFEEENRMEQVYHTIYEYAKKEEYTKIDDFINDINPNKEKTSVLLAVLTITSLSKINENITSRQRFYDITKETILKRGQSLDNLIGLE